MVSVHARYSMIADFVAPVQTTQGKSGQIIRSYNYDDPYKVYNITEGVLGGGIRSVGSTEAWGADYEPTEWVKMYIASNIVGEHSGGPVYVSRRFRVRNIVSRKPPHTQKWIGDDDLPVEFNVMGITPVHDPFGRAIEYELLLKGVTGD